MTDSTNLTVDYTRNKLRHSVLPVLKDVNPQVTQATSRFAESMRLQNEFVFACANELLCKAKTPYGYGLEILRSAHEAVLRVALELLLSSYGRLSYEHICRAASCIFVGGSLSLPGDIVLEAKQDTLTVRKNRERKDRNVFSVPLRAGENVLPNGKTLLVEKKIPEKEEIDRKVHNLLFQNFSDCDKITNVPRVRTRRAGDVFRPAGRGVTKSVKKILNELRIPAAARDCLLLLEKDGEIIWIEAVGAAEGYAAKPNFPALELTVTEISRDYADKNLLLVSVLKGSVVFMADLMRAITIPARIDFMCVSSYGSGTKTSGVVKIIKDLDINLKGYDIVIVEDILDSGKTLHYLVNLLKSREPNSIEICTLFDKPERREVEVYAKYKGCDIPDAFIVGYGLDFDEKYRNLPFVGVLKPEVYGEV